mmetsp:Transcript_120805/g.352876  ORF Transcript_120805/g.352876 Transcript_120805/m.352876 type:complete len:207 (+) Transcript_120805:1613-2233(+)
MLPQWECAARVHCARPRGRAGIGRARIRWRHRRAGCQSGAACGPEPFGHQRSRRRRRRHLRLGAGAGRWAEGGPRRTQALRRHAAGESLGVEADRLNPAEGTCHGSLARRRHGGCPGSAAEHDPRRGRRGARKAVPSDVSPRPRRHASGGGHRSAAGRRQQVFGGAHLVRPLPLLPLSGDLPRHGRGPGRRAEPLCLRDAALRRQD